MLIREFIFFCFIYRLSPPNCSFLGKKELHETHPWFEFLVQCREVSSNLTGMGTVLNTKISLNK